MGRRSYSGTAVPTVLSGGIGALDLSFTVQDATGYPDGSGGPFYVTLARGIAGEEKILCDSRSGLTFTVNATGRGADGTVATSHAASSTTVEHTITKTDVDEANAHVNQTAEADSPHPQYMKTSAANAAYATKTALAAARPRVSSATGSGVTGIAATATVVASLVVPDPGYTYTLLAAYESLVDLTGTSDVFDLTLRREGVGVRSARFNVSGSHGIGLKTCGTGLVGASSLDVLLRRSAGTTQTATVYADPAFHTLTAITVREG